MGGQAAPKIVLWLTLLKSREVMRLLAEARNPVVEIALQRTKRHLSHITNRLNGQRHPKVHLWPLLERPQEMV